jgi:histidine ammonia-lyase
MISIDGHHLQIDEIVKVARNYEKVIISVEGIKNIEKSYALKNQITTSNKAVYGINTGFGIFANKQIANKDASQLSRNLILSHAVGTGEPFSNEIVRAAMLVRANTLTKGFSGVRIEVVNTLIEMLNANLVPIIPSQGSLGSSGDLAPLSHLALVFTTDEKDLDEDSWFAFYLDQKLTGKEAMKRAGIPRLVLESKEGLAINNGATFSAAIAALSVYDSKSLIDLAEMSLALSLEAMLGCSSAFDHRIHAARGQLGQMEAANNVRRFIGNSNLINSTDRVQDAYSLRCAPQVQGVARDTLQFIWGIIEREINAATDNPLLFAPGIALSGGNFHGEPIGVAMDFLGIVLSEIASISERRINRMTDENLNAGLPPMLVDHPDAAGLNSGLMMPQYTAASLVLENQTLAHPDSVFSIPTSAEQEDHNANAMNACRHTLQILKNAQHVISIEFYTAARAIDLRLRNLPDGSLGYGTKLIYRLIRDVVPYQAGDALWWPEVETVKQLILGRNVQEALDFIKS